MYKLLSYFGEESKAVRKFVSDDYASWLDIPFDPDNTDYQQYLKWVEEGNSPLPADVEASPSTPLPADEGAA